MIYKRLLCVGLSLLFLAACASHDRKQALILRLGAEPSMLNPILSVDGSSSSVNGYIFNGLLTVDEQMQLVPDLAKRYEFSDDGTVIRFYLHEHIRWHDGAAFTAHDVKFTYDLIADPHTQTVRRSNYVIDGMPVEFVVINDYELEVRSPKAFAPLLNHLTMGILPKHIYEHEDVNRSKYNRQPIGTGPFTLRAWESAQYVLLNRNEDYFGKAPKLEKILLKIIPDNNTALVSFEREEVYNCGIPAKEYERISSNAAYQSFRYYDLNYTFMGFNLHHEFFKDLQVRQAISMAINKEAIVRGVLKGFAKEAHLPTSPTMWTYPSKPFSYEYNLEMAKQLLFDQGFRVDPTTGLLSRNGQAFSFKLITNKGNKDREKAAEIIQSNLKALGISVSIQLMEWSSFVAILSAKEHPKAFDAVMLGWGLGLDPDIFSVWHSSQYPDGFNFVGYNNASVDALLSKGRQELDPLKRKQIYATLYDTIAKELPYVFLYYPESLVGYSHFVKGLSAAGPSGLLNPIENISILEQ